MKYSEKLKDPRWQRRRLEIMQRDEFACLCCGDTEKTLNVHHKQYHGNPWDAPHDSLETLCEDCHKFRSDFNKFILNIDSFIILNFLDGIIGISFDDYISISYLTTALKGGAINNREINKILHDRIKEKMDK
jgi:hypothetical protein